MCREWQTRGPIACRVVRHERDLTGLAARWDELLAASVRPEAMLSPEWLTTWWRHYGGGHEMAVGVYEAEGQLVGLAPMCSRIFRYRPKLSFRRIEALGSDVDDGDSVCSDYLHLVVRPGFEAAVCDAFVCGMAAGDFGRWDEWVLSAVDGTHPLNGPLKEAWSRNGFAVEESATSESPFLALPATWEAFLASFNKKRRQSLKYAQRDFDAWAAGGATCHRAVDDATLVEGRRILAELHEQRWRAEGNAGVFVHPRFAAFHEDFMRQMLAAGRLELQWLAVKGRAVAAHYSFREFGKVYYYQTGRVIDVPAGVRLGIVLLMRAIEDAIVRGDREFDFLAGHAQYKSLFTHTARPIVQLRVARLGAREIARRMARWSADTWRTASRLVGLGEARPPVPTKEV